MISVEEAVRRIVAAFSPVEAETVSLDAASKRVLAEDVIARCNQPPFDVSAMDGYAVRAADTANPPVRLKVIGSSPAGHPFDSMVGANEAVRIFTGGVAPRGADTIVIQEDTDGGDANVQINVAAEMRRHIRPAAQDFRADDVLVQKGTRLGPRHLGLIAAGDVPGVSVRRRPRVVFAATGDELSPPGARRNPGGIVASSVYALSAQIVQWGGEPRSLGILPDRIESIAAIADEAASADLIVTLGGASVGEHDLIQRALGPKGFELDFWKIAMRPGKPLIFGHLGKTPLLGLPGNPVSSYVCALLFLKPAIAAMLGESVQGQTTTVRAGADLKANDGRQDYIRARLVRRNDALCAEPSPVQDSSMQRLLAEADVLIVRPPHAPAAEEGDEIRIIPLE